MTKKKGNQDKPDKKPVPPRTNDPELGQKVESSDKIRDKQFGIGR
ncbi:MAG: hypothetical protein ABR958_03805 [Dehalococcoidales bacterium]